MDRSLRALLSALALLLSVPANAYPTPVDFDGSVLRWDVGIDDPPITYEVEADQEQDKTVYAAAVDDAAALWTDVPTSYFAFVPATGTEKAQVTIKLQRQIEGGDYSAGYTIFDEYDGKAPKHCAIYVLVEDGFSYTSMAKTFLHELGHCVGLGHTMIPEAIMSYSLDKNSFALDIDDEAAITRLYPGDGSKPKLPPGCAVGGGTEGKGGATLLALLVTPLLLALGGRRHRHPSS